MMRNFQYLDKIFEMYGVKYFVRISRLGKTKYDNPFDFEDIMPILDKVTSDNHISLFAMYNYFIFELKSTMKKTEGF